MKRTCLSLLALFGTVSTFASPTVSVTSIAQNVATRTVTVVYSLDEDAVVTFGVETNSVALPPSSVRRVWGDVNRLVKAGSARTVYWAPEVDWPEGPITDGALKAVVKAWAKDNPPDWRVTEVMTNMIGLTSHRYYECAEQVPGGITNDRYKATALLMRRVRATGVTWRMGRGLMDLRNDYVQERPYYVTLTNDYYLGIYEVTHRQYYYLANADNLPTNEYGTITFCPRTKVSYDTIVKNLPLMRTRTGISGLNLPTEAEWEFACRAGCDAELYNGERLTDKDQSVDTTAHCQTNLEDIAWYVFNAMNESYPHKVGLKQPNDWGFYDMLGNVWEVALDRYVDNPQPEDARVIAPANLGTSGDVVRRGGCFADHGSCTRSAFRNSYNPGNTWIRLGFRLKSPAVAE